MLRRTLQRIIPTYAVLPLFCTGLTFLLCYQGPKLIQAIFGAGNAMDMETQLPTIAKLDAMFPFTPAWSFVYLFSVVFMFYQHTTAARESPEAAYRLAAADLFGKLICMIFFIAMPTTNERPLVEGDGFIAFFMRFVYRIDTPTNLFPSLHCFIAWLGTRQIFEAKNPRFRVLNCTLCLIGSLLVFISTLYTKQHVIIDIFAGVALAEIAFVIAKHTGLPNIFKKLNEWFMTTKLCRFYDK